MSYYPKQESTHIIYLDANNLYGYGMSKFLPRNGFKWIDSKEINILVIVQKDASLKLILNIQKNYENSMMIIL